MADTQESIKNYSERVYAQEMRLHIIDGKTTQVIRKSGVTETTVAIEGEDDVQFTGQVLNDFVYGKEGVVEISCVEDLLPLSFSATSM